MVLMSGVRPSTHRRCWKKLSGWTWFIVKTAPQGDGGTLHRRAPPRHLHSRECVRNFIAEVGTDDCDVHANFLVQPACDPIPERNQELQ